MADGVDSSESRDDALSEIESVCFSCFKNGNTRLLLTKIPYFKDIVVSSFCCEHCGWENRSLIPVSSVADNGQKIKLTVLDLKDFSRRVVIPAGSSIILPKYDSTFPFTDGKLTTVEGAVTLIIDNLNNMQPEREILDDPSGQGYIENFKAPHDDPQLELTKYQRSKEQNELLGFSNEIVKTNDNQLTVIDEEHADDNTDLNIGQAVPHDEVLSFSVNCPSCNAVTLTNMKVVDIPFFKEVVLMAINCSECGYKDAEVRSGTGIAPQGRKYRLRITNLYDLSRDLLVSENASIKLPDLDFESVGGTLGGRFTTIEGLLVAIKKQLVDTNPFVEGDSSVGYDGTRQLSEVIKEFDQILNGEKLNVIFELIDPTGSSYIQNIYAPDPDPELEITDYDRTEEENDALGLTDMRVKDYEK